MKNETSGSRIDIYKEANIGSILSDGASPYGSIDVVFTVGSSTPSPNPTPSMKETPAKVVVDHDTFTSEAPAKTVIAAGNIGAASFFDMKLHAADERTNINQKFLAQYYVSPNANILLTTKIYPRRDLGMAEDGVVKTLSWNNLPKNQAGPVSTVTICK